MVSVPILTHEVQHYWLASCWTTCFWSRSFDLALHPVLKPPRCAFILLVHMIIHHASLFPDLFVDLLSYPNSYI